MEQVYNLTVTRTTDGNLKMNSTNDGFGAFEILGFLEFKAADIMEQIKGNIKPDTITRTAIKD